MARIPVATDLGRTSARSGRGVARQNTTAEGLGVVSIGRGLEQAGSDFQAVADTMRQRQTTLDIAKADAAFNEGAIEIGNAFDKDADYSTYGDRASSMYSQRVREIAAGISDPRARELWLLSAQSKAANQVDSLRDRGVALQTEADVVTLEQSIRTNFAIATDPSVPQEVREKARSDIAGAIEVASGVLLDPSEAAAFAERYVRGADTTLATNQANLELVQNPEALISDLGIPESREDYFRSIRAAESGGNDAATNPNSTSQGRYGFLESTWKGLVERHPNAGLTLDGRMDPRQQEIAVRLFTEENAAVLERAGIAPTNGNLYAAHFLGAGGAAKVLSAPDGASVAGYVEPRVIDANPFLKGMSVGEFKAWAARKGGGRASDPAPRFAELPFDQRLTLFERAGNEIAQRQTAATVQQNAAYDMAREQIETGILQGSVVSEGQIWGNPDLRPEDQNTLVRALRTELEATGAAREYLAGIALGTAAPLNAYDAEARSLGEKAFGVLEKSLPEEQREAGAMEFISTSGYVPKAIVADVRQGLSSGDVAQVQASMQRAASLQVMAPNGLRAIENGSDIIKAAEMAQAYTAMGYTLEQAAQKYVAANDPQSIREREALLKSKPVADAIKNVTTDDIAQMFPGVWVGGYGPGMAVGQNPAQAAAMVSEYKSFYEEAIVDANGDMAVAQELAKNRFTRLYGPSEMTRLGGSAIVRLPPEKTYPALPDGSVGYVREQVEAALREEGVEFSDISLEAYDATDADFRNGAPPRYQVAYLADGQWQLFNLPFVADPAAAMSEYQEARQSQLNEAQTRRETNMQTEIEREQAAGNLPPAEALDQLSQEEWINRNRMLNEVVGGGQ